jgi:hypothetical protein
MNIHICSDPNLGPGSYPSPVPGPGPSPMIISTEKLKSEIISEITHDDSNDFGDKSNDNIDKFYSNNYNNEYKNTVNKMIKTPKNFNSEVFNSFKEKDGITKDIPYENNPNPDTDSYPSPVPSDHDTSNNINNDTDMEVDFKQYVQSNKNKYVTSQNLQEAMENMNYNIHTEVQSELFVY